MSGTASFLRTTLTQALASSRKITLSWSRSSLANIAERQRPRIKQADKAVERSRSTAGFCSGAGKQGIGSMTDILLDTRETDTGDERIAKRSWINRVLSRPEFGAMAGAVLVFL